MSDAGPQKMTDGQLLDLVNAEYDRALGAPGGDIARERALAWDYYLQRPFGDEIEGESSVVTADVADVVDGILPSLLRIFTTADNLVSFDPVGPEDEAAAAQESDYVSYIFFKRNPAFEILHTWFMDGLIQKNGVVKAWADDSETVTQEEYEGLSEPELLKLMDDEELEPVERSEREAETVAIDGVTPIKTTVHDITFRRVKKCKVIRVAPVAPEEYRISPDAQSLDPSLARFVGQERDVTRSELIDMGFKKDLVYSLPQVDATNMSSPERRARRDTAEELDTVATDKSQEKVRFREAYYRVDFDGDGRSELRQVLTGGGQLLSNEMFDRQPFHTLSPHPLPHKHFGRASGEKVMDVQRVNSTLVRQTLTNLYHVNRPGHAVWEAGIGENTLDDLLTTRIGRIARFARPVSESYQPMTVPFTAQASFPVIEFFDKAKRDRTGVSPDSEGLSPDALKNIQTTVLAQANNMGRMKIEAIARIFAETGIKSLFLHIHELVLKHQYKAEIVKLRNQWVPVDPSEWKTRVDMTVNIGLGIGTREQNLVHLSAVKDIQAAIAEGGGMNLVVTPKNIFNMAAEFVKNANLRNPSLYFTDPGDKPAPPPSDQQAALQQQQQQLEARQQQLDAERNRNAAAKIHLDAREQELQAQKDRFEIYQQQQELKLQAGELQRKRDADRADVSLQIQGLKNELTEMFLKHGFPPANAVRPGAPAN